MPDKKLTDSEIVKALECCGTYKGKCTDCPAFVKVDRSNCKKVLLGAIDLINRQKADYDSLQKAYLRNQEIFAEQSLENERLKAEVDNYKSSPMVTLFEQWKEDIKAEAYKEFAESVQGEIDDAIHSNYNAKEERQAKRKKLGILVSPIDDFLMYYDGKIHALSGINSYIDNLLKELVGEDK